MNPETSNPPTKRKFLPDLVETTSRSSSSPLKPQVKNEPILEQQKSPALSSNPNPATSSPAPEIPPKRAVRFAPQVVETSMKEHRGNNVKKSTEATAGERHRDAQQNTSGRKFSPQLIETGKRSFRQNKAVYPGQHYRHVKPADKKDLPSAPGLESRYSYANLLRRQQAKEGGRRHSFRVPELPAIPCSSSDESARSPPDSSSASTSPTVLSEEASRKHSSKSPSAETSDDPYSSNYFCDIVAARSAQKLLRDQALAAFPNEQVHQPVSHFAIDREDDDETTEDEDAMLDSQIDLYTFRRGSTVDLGWELEEMRRHKEDAELRERDRRFAAGHSKFSAASLAAKRMMNNIDENGGQGHDIIGGWQKDVNLAQMRRAASPPMLGDDIVFAKCLSPQSTFCENDPDAAASQEDADAKHDACLWQADHHTDNKFDGGLWHGCCIRPPQTSKEPENERRKTPAPNHRLGIVTPAVHSGGTPLSIRSKPIEEPVKGQLPSRPSGGKTSQLKDMHQTLEQEEEIQREFHDGFVTQIFNYLSLGYPCLARPFDDELSKISHIPVEDLRKDDQNTDAKGYVRAPEGTDAAGAKCMRWSALKSYIHEWARQQPRMTGPDDSLDAWGAGARRGSWGF